MISRIIKRDINSLHVKNAYETIVANIELGARDELKSKMFLVTSCNPKEGKSTITKGLGLYSSRTSMKTIIVACDLRSREDSKHQLLKPSPGLVECLEGETTPTEVIERMGENLYYLPRGRKTQNQTKLFMSDEFDKLLALLKDTYDLILLDGPSLNDGPDSVVISAKSKGVILVISTGVTTFKQIGDAMEQFESAGAEIVGAVLNKASR
ncbi:CpsD/CapB family tyrosine-protein kinase [Alkalibacter mobilis]|uniref:CpsD/CapB family tyrosine-protein kinase n=1 Tax=Alkalibacter mobilis TaxID=2787712 RepID=UPI00189D68CE|nr:CpsD/CapB family tyrosine-protein kinase [Alkalibacter mobilis]MBF7097343.1 CpsD/CapB family tyrosine-protein kinase [Alkalibacter mobilis]